MLGTPIGFRGSRSGSPHLLLVVHKLVHYKCSNANSSGGVELTAPDLTDVPIAELVSLQGQTAVVTGGARGIGAAIVQRFREAGATVYATDHDPAGDDTAVLLDVTDSDAVSDLADRVVSETGRLDIWVNNAGIYPPTPILEMTDEDWDAVLDVNLKGAFVGAREAARRMGDTGGVIVNIASVSGYRGRKSLAHYSSSKHGLRGLTRSLAVELGERGIRALAIAPTMIVTPGTDQAVPSSDPATRHTTDVYAQLPLGRPGVPDDVARVALFCASPMAAFMTGSTLAVDAGQMSM
jgi:NAD(P)-dependent dehydrogenase (short-subunit alcohol dehydrogenase family)